VVQDRTRFWYPDLLPLGELTTFETLFHRRVPRTKIEGSWLGVDEVSMLTILSYTVFPGKYFTFGTLTIDYKNNTFSGTLWERWRVYEVDSDLRSYYQLNYLYKKL
jgi:hypothetical protein